MYTLEKHLHLISIENPQFEVLDSMWKLNKNFIPNAQSAIGFNFPHYSMHERSHSETIIKNIESFLGEERIKQLSPTDTWLILMSAFTHDLGMIVFYETLEKKWEESEFQKYLLKTSENTRDRDLQNSAKLLLSIKNLSEYDKDNKLNLPLEIRNAVIQITADFFRRNHHFRSRDILTGTDKSFYKLINGFNLNGIPNRFGNILGEVAYAHGIDFYDIIDRLEYRADGYGSDKMHPRFIACLLRLGDLLDVDDKRFNIFYEKVFYNKLPDTSNAHKEKHAAVRHLLISPSSIEVTVDCQTDAAYRVARDWFDYLQKEVEHQSKEWSSIAPSSLLGMPPAISRGKIKVLYQSAEPKPELMNLRFAISNEKVFEMFEGSAIYENADFVFLRELVQNAVDATKIQLWKDLKSGVYDYALRRHLNLPAEETNIYKRVYFPIDIPAEIWDNYQISLKVYWKEKDKYLTIEVEDRGTGISEKDLIRMTQKVGESRSKDDLYQKTMQEMPYWLKPTGAFGIGLQSLFLINNSFTVHTKSEYESAKEILFYSAKNGDYSRVTTTKPLMNRGTKIFIDIPCDDFNKLIIESNDYFHENTYDIFSLKYEHIFFHKLINYIEKEFSKINLLNTIVLGDRIKESSIFNQDFIADKLHYRDPSNKLLVILNNITKNGISFEIYENVSIGSKMEIFFRNTIGSGRTSNSFFVRDIPVDHIESDGIEVASHYYSLSWNFQSESSDKILNISRDKFIRKTAEKIEKKFHNEILEKVMTIIIDLLNKHAEQNDIKDYRYSYFNADMTARSFNVNGFTTDIYDNCKFAPTDVSKTDKSTVLIKDFLQTHEYILIHHINYKRHYFDYKDIYNAYEEHKNKPIAKNIVLWSEGYFYSYLRDTKFTRIEIKSFIEDDGIYHNITVSNKSNKYDIVKTNKTAYQISLLTIYTNKSSKCRQPILSQAKYKNSLVVHGDIEGGYGMWLLNNYIISPFTKLDEYLNIKNHFQKKKIETSKNEIINEIKAKFITDLLPQKLISWIITHSIAEVPPSSEEIIQNYCELIIDFLEAENNVSPAFRSFLDQERDHYESTVLI